MLLVIPRHQRSKQGEHCRMVYLALLARRIRSPHRGGERTFDNGLDSLCVRL